MVCYQYKNYWIMLYSETIIQKNILDTFTPFYKNLNDNKEYSLFQQDCATAHQVNNLLTGITNIFCNQMIFTLCGLLIHPFSINVIITMEKFDKPGILEQSTHKGKISRQHQMCSIANFMTRTSKNFQLMFTGCQACLTAERGHFQHLL